MTGALIVLALLAQPATRVAKDFEAANERLLSGDAKGALALYEHLVAEGASSADLWFNLGNAYAEHGQSVEAIVAYERALRLDPGDADARANAELLRQKLGIEPVLEPAEPVDWVEPIVAPLAADGFALLALVSNLVLFALLFARRWVAQGALRRVISAWIGAALVGLFVGGAVVLGHSVVHAAARGVAKEASAMTAGPHPEYARTDDAKRGERLRVLSEQAGWYEVRTARGTSGWLPKTKVERF